ncbi:MAG: hypothetical protein JW810_10500 [Sedimentisphaerales bacterium]|nr:hypothetical protein [Sedimentisphaerales bacterium]
MWKIRTVKDYTDAHNHIIVGRVMGMTDSYVRLHCRSYHFGKQVESPEDIQEGCLMVRIIPWHRVEIINELAPSFNYTQAKLTTDEKHEVVLRDGVYVCSLGFAHNKRF